MAALARHMPKELREALIKVRTEVEKNCEHVGDKFAEEARKIHYGEGDKRGIYGETSEEEAEALADEGIEFGRLPVDSAWPKWRTFSPNKCESPQPRFASVQHVVHIEVALVQRPRTRLSGL